MCLTCGGDGATPPLPENLLRQTDPPRQLAYMSRQAGGLGPSDELAKRNADHLPQALHCPSFIPRIGQPVEQNTIDDRVVQAGRAIILMGDSNRPTTAVASSPVPYVMPRRIAIPRHHWTAAVRLGVPRLTGTAARYMSLSPHRPVMRQEHRFGLIVVVAREGRPRTRE